MKKILILLGLITPIMAHAVGPNQADDPVIADDYPPYELAEILPGDSTTAVSASYVKGAYNDAIAAVNSLKHEIYEEGDVFYNTNGNLMNRQVITSSYLSTDLSDVPEDMFLTGGAVISAIEYQIRDKRVNAVTTWGSNNVTQLEFADAE